MSYELHPLCRFFPRITGDEFAALCEDIRANGLQQPIVLHDGQILDGGNRYRACVETGAEPIFAEYDGANLVQFVLSANLHRRHLTPGQHASIVASMQDWAKAQSHGGRRIPSQAATLPLETVADRAAASGASERTQRMADKVARVNPELAVKVGHGEVSLPAAVAQVEGKEPKPGRAEKLEARIAELEAEIELLGAALAQAEDAAEQAVDTAANLQTIADGDEAKRLDLLTLKLRNAESQKNALMNENAALKRQIKAMQRQVARAA